MQRGPSSVVFIVHNACRPYHTCRFEFSLNRIVPDHVKGNVNKVKEERVKFVSRKGLGDEGGGDGF